MTVVKKKLFALFFIPLILLTLILFSTYFANNSFFTTLSLLSQRPKSPIPPPPVDLTEYNLSSSEPIILNSLSDVQKYNITQVDNYYYIRYLNITTDQPYAIVINCSIQLTIEYCFLKSSNTSLYLPPGWYAWQNYIKIRYCEFYGLNGILTFDNLYIFSSAFYVSNTSITLYNDVEVHYSYFYRCVYPVWLTHDRILDIYNTAFVNTTYGIYYPIGRYSADCGGEIFYNNFLFVLNYALYFVNSSFDVQFNDFILCNNSTNGSSQAYDDGTKNKFTGNFWLYWNYSNPYPIDGSANNYDTYPLMFPNWDTNYDYFVGYTSTTSSTTSSSSTSPSSTTSPPSLSTSISPFPFFSLLSLFFLLLLKLLPFNAKSKSSFKRRP